ncbi:MAG: hypothetical protein ACI4OG_02710 [Bacilli bacterium]
MQERSDICNEKLKIYVVELAMLEYIFDNNLITIEEYKIIKNKIKLEYAKYKTLNNSDYSFA